MPVKTTFNVVKQRAARKGLHLTRYNPGDRVRYRVHKQVEDYFDGGLFSCFTLKEVEAYIQGWHDHKCEAVEQ